MKSCLFFIIVFSVLHLNAQENLEVKLAQLAIDSGMQPAFVVDIPQAESKNAIKIWEDRLVPKDLFSTFKKLPKMEKEDKDKWFISGVVIDEISPDTLKIYTRINSYKGGISFSTLFKTDQGFIGSDTGNSELNQRAMAYVRANAVEIYRQAVQDELDELKKELKKMEKDYDAFNKDNRKLNKKSRESETNLTILNPKPLENESITPLPSEEKQKEIKKEEKALKKYEKKIDKNTNKQKKLEKDIKKKEDEIKEVEAKLKNIK